MLKFKILNPPKMTRAYVCMKISEYPPPPLGTCTQVPPGKPDWSHSDRKVAKSGLGTTFLLLSFSSLHSYTVLHSLILYTSVHNYFVSISLLWTSKEMSSRSMIAKCNDIDVDLTYPMDKHLPVWTLLSF